MRVLALAAIWVLGCGPQTSFISGGGIEYRIQEGIGWTREDVESYEVCAWARLAEELPVKDPRGTLAGVTIVDVTPTSRACNYLGKPTTCSGLAYVDEHWADLWVSAEPGLAKSSLAHEMAHAILGLNGRPMDHAHKHYNWGRLNNPCEGVR
jgi:hypothetical protein